MAILDMSNQGCRFQGPCPKHTLSTVLSQAANTPNQGSSHFGRGAVWLGPLRKTMLPIASALTPSPSVFPQALTWACRKFLSMKQNQHRMVGTGFGASQKWGQIWPCCLPNLGCWASHFTSLSLYFLTYKMRDYSNYSEGLLWGLLSFVYIKHFVLCLPHSRHSIITGIPLLQLWFPSLVWSSGISRFKEEPHFMSWLCPDPWDYSLLAII